MTVSSKTNKQVEAHDGYAALHPARQSIEAECISEDVLRKPQNLNTPNLAAQYNCYVRMEVCEAGNVTLNFLLCLELALMSFFS